MVVVAPPADAAEGPAVAAEARRAGAEVVVPRTRPAEMRDSIELGLDSTGAASCPRSLVLLTPGDYPGITPEMVARLVEHAAQHAGPHRHPHSQRPARPSDRLAVDDRGRDPYAARRASGVNALVARHADSVVELTCQPRSSPTSTRRRFSALVQRRRRRAIAEESDARSEFRPERRRQSELISRARSSLRPGEGSGRALRVEIELRHGSKVADLRAALGRAPAGACAVAPNRHDRRGRGVRRRRIPIIARARGWP